MHVDIFNFNFIFYFKITYGYLFYLVKMFKNGSSKFSVFENRYNKVFNYEINETLNQEKDKFFFNYTKNYNKTKDENYESIRILDENKNIVEYVSQNREPWKSEENSKRKNYYLFYLDKVIFNRNMLGYHKYLF